jgi:hypothetical protein
MKRRALIFASAALSMVSGCFGGGVSDYTGWVDTGGYDGDGDGFYEDEDCDDDDAAVNPVADEVCDDGIDNDCDGLIDGDDDECA